MRRNSFLFALSIVFISCQKIHDLITVLPIPPAPQFNKVYGESVHDEITAFSRSADDGYILTGYTYFGKDDDDTSTTSNYKSWVLKVDRSGNKLWQKTLDTSGKQTAYAITKSGDGGFILAGTTFDTTISGHHGLKGDAWLVKIDAWGNLLWQKALGGSNLDWAYSITTTWDGYVMAGLSESNDGDVSGNHKATAGYNSQDAWVIKLDSHGNKQWQASLGGSGLDRAYSVTTTWDGYVMAGYTESSDGDVSGFHGYDDVWVVKLDGQGKKQWQKALGGSNFEYATSVITASDGGFVVAGYTASNDGDVSGNHGGLADAWVVKLDGHGNRLWQKTLGGSERDGALAITQSVDGGYVMAGTTESSDGDVSGFHGISDAWVVKLDKNGNMRWQKSLGGSYDDDAKAIVTRLDESYVLAGKSQSDDGDVGSNNGGFDVWVRTIPDED